MSARSKTVLWTKSCSHLINTFSLRSKRFRLVSEQIETEERDFGFGPARNETRANDSRSSFFAPKPNENAC